MAEWTFLSEVCHQPAFNHRTAELKISEYKIKSIELMAPNTFPSFHDNETTWMVDVTYVFVNKNKEGLTKEQMFTEAELNDPLTGRAYFETEAMAVQFIKAVYNVDLSYENFVKNAV